MAITYTVKLMRETGFEVTGQTNAQGRNLVNHTARQTYQVRCTPTAGETADYVTDVDVGCATGLPIVNRTTWFSSLSGTTMPYAVCRRKSVKRNRDKNFWFDVECTFETGMVEGEQCQVVPPTVPSDVTPQVTSDIGSYDRVLYTDKDGDQCWQLPTGTPYAAPVTETIPTLTLAITQFETGITFDQMLARSFKLNSATYRSKPAGYWMTGAVQAIDQVVTVDALGTQETWAKVTYPVKLSERFYWPPGVDATPANAIIYSHDHVQPLVDTMKIDGGKLVPITDAGSGNVKAGYIDSAGAERVPAAANEERPDYVRHRSQDFIDFSTFLQV